MADPAASTTAAPHATKHELERNISQAAAEGHDADIPSSAGYVLNTEEEKKLAESIALQKSKSKEHPAGREEAIAPDVEKEAALGSSSDTKTEEQEDENVVFWSGPDDPENPYNWPVWRKVANCGLLSAMVFIAPLASSIFAPGVPQLLEEFQTDNLEIAAFVVSVYILGFAFGPLVLAPLSEIYGRVYVYHACNVGFVAFLVGCALAPSMNSLIVFRFFSGIFGSCSVTNGGGSIADMVRQESRGAAMAVFSIGPLLGPIIGPIAGGFLSDAKGWRWNFWLLLIVAGFLSIAMIFVLKESYAPVILQRKTLHLRKETGSELLRSKLDAGLSPKDYFLRGIIRPMKMLVFSPMIALTSLYMGITYGYLYLLFTSMTFVFEEYYGFAPNLVGLSYIGLGIGSLTGVIVFSITSDKYIKAKAAQADAEAEATGREKEGMKPEYRLPSLPIGAILIPAGLFIYGWTAEYHVHWIVPILGTLIVGAGNLIIFMAVQMYLVDGFTIYAASALAANTVVRSVLGAVLPLGGLQMYQRLGMGWGNSLLAFIALAFLPVAFGLLRYGEFLRKKYEIKNL